MCLRAAVTWRGRHGEMRVAIAEVRLLGTTPRNYNTQATQSTTTMPHNPQPQRNHTLLHQTATLNHYTKTTAIDTYLEAQPYTATHPEPQFWHIPLTDSLGALNQTIVVGVAPSGTVVGKELSRCDLALWSRVAVGRGAGAGVAVGGSYAGVRRQACQ